jgi:hypothetical protein
MLLWKHRRDAYATLETQAGRLCYFGNTGGTPMLLWKHRRDAYATLKDKDILQFNYEQKNRQLYDD